MATAPTYTNTASRAQLANFLAGAILDEPRTGPTRGVLHQLVHRMETVAGWSDFSAEVAEEAQEILANRDDTVAAPAPWSYRPPRPVLDRDRLEGDRYLVLLACGHWVHTRQPDADTFGCPVVEPVEENHGMQPPALTEDGYRAVLGSWDLFAAPVARSRPFPADQAAEQTLRVQFYRPGPLGEARQLGDMTYRVLPDATSVHVPAGAAHMVWVVSPPANGRIDLGPYVEPVDQAAATVLDADDAAS